MKKRFEFLGFATADAVFKAYGKSLPELFENAALALFEIMVNTKKVKPKVKKHIRVSAKDLKELMFRWLNELIFYPDAEGLAFSKFRIKLDEKKLVLEADVWGERIDPERHELREDVKACTYHKLELKKKKGGWEAQVIVDI